MIVTKLKPIEEILEMVKGLEKIFIVGCGSCAKQCKAGGEDDVKEMALRLSNHGKTVTGSAVPDETCHIPSTGKEMRKHKKPLEDSDCVLVMACGAGTAAVREHYAKKIYPASDTISLSSTVRIGRFAGKCSLCGECVIGFTNGICPVTLCPKGMLNGPCGGMDKGKCEVDTSEDCVWNTIYEELSRTGGLDEMKKIRMPKNNSKTKKSAKVGARPSAVIRPYRRRNDNKIKIIEQIEAQ